MKSWVACAALAAAFAAGAQQPLSLRPELVGPLRSAQELLQQRKFAEALSALAPTDAIAGKTPQETYTVERLRAGAAAGLADTPLMIRALEASLASGQTPAAEQPALMEALVDAYLGLKRYPDAAQWARRHIQLAPTPRMRTLLAQALYQAADYRGAATELQAAVQPGTKPTKAQLELLAASHVQLKDDAGYAAALEQLVAWYPNRDHWADLLVRLERKPGFDSRLTLDLFRLQFAAGALLEAADYLELAQMAFEAGFPAEAVKVMEAGYAAAALGTGPDADRHQRFRLQMEERARDQLKALEASPLPAGAEALFLGGYALFTQGRVQPGLAAMQQALDQGGLPRADEARLRLGFAYGRSGNADRAGQLLSQVQAAGAADGSADIARLARLLFK